ncbi:MAG: AhpC/TSA family protein [Prevotella sp.]|nr:AhpC/TSA family protein [Prevotella sp.]
MKAFQASILFSAVVLALTACHSNTYKISGAVEGLNDGDTLFITNDLQTGIPTDTLIVKDGKFELSGETDSTYLCMVYSEKRNEVNAPFFIEPGNISIKLVETPGMSRVGGTRCNEQWQELNDSVMFIGKEINRIAEHIYGNTIDEMEQQKGMEQIEKLNQRFSAIVVKTTEKNIKNEFGYFLLTYYPEELIDNQTRMKLIDKLPDEKQKRPAIQEMLVNLKQAAESAEGMTIKNFTQPGLDGTPLSLLGEVAKSKITVIDFWASWCGPCRQEMPFMLELYGKYKNKGLNIIGISLDEDSDAWKAATQQLNIPWIQMSDLKGWENTIAKHFCVNSIPHTIVVDQKGKILKRGLRGEKLEEFVDKQLK